ncbi:MAG: hypothetical protein ACRYFB_11415 [Janthinobacterium lividum]
MSEKPFSPKIHGLNDYAFVAILFFAPPLLGFNKKAINLYRLSGLNLLIYNSLTDQPVALKPLISYETHHKLDLINVAGLALATFYKGIRKEKRVLAFHTAFVVLAAINVVLTDWKAEPQQP